MSNPSPPERGPHPSPRRCKGHKRNGDPCKLPPIKGADVCGSHGGRAPQVRKAAARRVAEEKVQKAAAPWLRDAPPVNDAAQALRELAGEVIGWKSWLSGELSNLGEWAPGEEPPPLADLYGKALDRAGRILADLHRTGVDEREIDLAEQAAGTAADLLADVLAELDGNPEAQAAVRAAVARAMG